MDCANKLFIWILMRTCLQGYLKSIRKGKTPQFWIHNGLKFPDKPDELDLTSLEERLVSPRLPFMQLREMPSGGQLNIKGNVVNVPADVSTTIKSLPRMMNEHETIMMKLKRKLSYKHYVSVENIRPNKVYEAAKWLVQNSSLFKGEGIVLNESWHCQPNKNFVVNEDEQNDDAHLEMQSDGDCWTEDDTFNGRLTGNMETCLQSIDFREFNKVLCLAPVEAQQTCDTIYTSAGMEPILPFRLQVPSSGVTTYQVGHKSSMTTLFEVLYINGNVYSPTIINWCEYGPDVDLAAGKLDLKLLQVTSSRNGRYQMKIPQTGQLVQCIDVILLGAPTKPKITASTVPYVGENLVLTCSSSHTTVPADGLTMNNTWIVDTVTNPADARYVYSSNRGILTINSVVKADAQIQIKCRATEAVTGGLTSTDSDVHTIIILYGPDGITLNPSQIVHTVTAGSPVPPITCSADCYPGCSYAWTKNGSPIASSSGNLSLGTVDRTDSGSYRCTATNSNRTEHTSTSSVIVVTVQLSVTSVRLTIPSLDTVTVSESNDISFTCLTDTGIPMATVEWYKDPGTVSDTADDHLFPTSYTDTIYDINTMVTTSTLTLSANKNDHNIRIYCRARNLNTTSWFASKRTVKVIVWYAPGPLTIEGLLNNSIYYMIRNSSQTLTCSVTGGRPQPQLTWSCYNGQVGSTVINVDTVSSSITWTSVGLESTCSCTSQQIVSGSTKTILFIKVLYPPETPTLTMGSKEVSSVYLTEGESLIVICKSSSSPSPSRYTWLQPNGLTTQGQQLHIDSVQYHVIPVYTCIVENRMIPSQGAEVAGSSSVHLPVIVSYTPRHINKYQTKEDVEVVPGTKVVLSATLAAFPLPSVYIWTRCKTGVCSVIHNTINTFISTFGLTSNLTIMNTQQKDFGQYRLMVDNRIGQPFNYTFLLREKVSENNPTSTETRTSLIAGVVGGVVALAVIVTAVIVLYLARCKAGGKGARAATLYQNSRQNDQYNDDVHVHEQTPAGQHDPNINAGAGISSTSTSHAEYIGLSQYGNVQNPYEELDAGIGLHTRTEKTY